MLTATRRNQLYVVDEKIDRAMLAEKEANKKLLKWHQRYGRININNLKKMKTKERIIGMKFMASLDLIVRYVPSAKYMFTHLRTPYIVKRTF